MNPARLRLALWLTLAWLLPACEKSPTAVPPLEQSVLQERAKWSGFHLTQYAYVYAYRWEYPPGTVDSDRVVVLGGAVGSATDLRTGGSVPVGEVPTLDGLLAQAVAAAGAGTLSSIAFDPTYGYPSRMEFPGPADGPVAITASSLQLLP